MYKIIITFIHFTFCGGRQQWQFVVVIRSSAQVLATLAPPKDVKSQK